MKKTKEIVQKEDTEYPVVWTRHRGKSFNTRLRERV